MMSNSDFINSIINEVVPYMNQTQIDLLKGSLTKHFYNYEVKEMETQIVPGNYMDFNYQYIHKFIIEKTIQGMSDETLETYARETRNFLEFIQKDFKSVNKDDVTVYLAWRKMGKKGLMVDNCTVDNIRRSISPFFRWLQENDYITKNPFLSVKPLKHEQKMKEYLSDIDIVCLQDACITKREKALIDFLLSTGVRVSELASVRVEDIDFTSGKVNIYGKKTRKHRVNYLQAGALKHVKEYLEDRPYNNDYVFSSDTKRNKKTEEATLQKQVQAIAERAEIKKHLTVHVFRRTVATTFYKKGVGLKYIAEYLGHGVNVLEKHYLIPSEEDMAVNIRISGGFGY